MCDLESLFFFLLIIQVKSAKLIRNMLSYNIMKFIHMAGSKSVADPLIINPLSACECSCHQYVHSFPFSIGYILFF